MGTALSTTGNKHHTPCLIGVAISPLNPNAPHLVMGSSAEENDGVRVSLGGEQCVYSSGAHCISIRMMRMCALECVCVCAGAHARASACVFVNICEVSWVGAVGRCVTKCVCVHACACANARVCACMYQRLCMCVCAHVLCVCSCVYVCVQATVCDEVFGCVCLCASCSHDVISRLSACVCVCLCVCNCARLRVCFGVYV